MLLPITTHLGGLVQTILGNLSVIVMLGGEGVEGHDVSEL